MIIKARIKTRQKKFMIKTGDVWEISLTSEPVGNKANLELVKQLSKCYKNVKIVRGLKSAHKILSLETGTTQES